MRRTGFVPSYGPPSWTSGTLFPQASRKLARAVNAASGTFGVRLELPNEKQLVPAGAKCRVRFLKLGPDPAGGPATPARPNT